MFLWGQTDEKFFELLRAGGKNIEEATETFLKGLEDPGISRPELARSLKGMEDRGDSLTNSIVSLLSTYFVTPFDRDDIMALAVSMDDVVDRVEAAAARLSIYNLERNDDIIMQLARIVLEQGRYLNQAIDTLCARRLKEVLSALDPVDELEKRGDQVLRRGLGQLFEGATDPFMVIKKKEVYETLELASDFAKDVAGILRTLVINHA